MSSEVEAPIRLYTQKTNPYAEKVARALDWKGRHFERVIASRPEDIRRWSPVTRELPVLEVAGRRRADSAAILAWLEELWPEPPLLSRDSVVAQQQRRLAEWSDKSFVWYWNRWRAARFPRPGDERPAPAGRIARLGDGLVRRLSRRPAAPSQAELRELEIVAELAKRLDEVTGWLGDRAFLLADEPSWADLSVCGMLEVMRQSALAGGAELLAERPALGDYMERLDAATRARAPARSA